MRRVSFADSNLQLVGIVALINALMHN